MAGIYIHIPFCQTKCIYCDFYSQTNQTLIKEYIDCLAKEIENNSSIFKEEIVSTIYFGGGTPSLLGLEDINTIIEKIKTYFTISKDAEWTFEGNPEDITPAYSKGLAQMDFNRVSLGVQSFNDLDLKFLNRRHSSEQVFKSISFLKDEGFNNLNIDLIYALPNQSLETWRTNLEKAISLSIPHISAYHLIYEQGTRITNLVKNGRIKQVEEEDSLKSYQILCKILSDNQYEHYEVSNFSKKGFASLHNSSYWTRIPYLGFGVAAHSFYKEKRWSNIANIKEYCSLIKKGDNIRQNIEHLSSIDQYNEIIMLGLRMKKGVNLLFLKQHLGYRYLDIFLKKTKSFCQKELLLQEGDYIKASEKGFLLIDGIISDLFLE